MEEAPATARRHLKQHLDLTFEVAWLDPMDRRGAVVDLMKAMSIASRLVKLDGGDTSAFASEIARFRDSIIEPRLQTLPDADARRLAIRADRYLTEVAIADGASRSKPEANPAAMPRSRDRLDQTIAIGRAILEIETRDSELTAEVGLCLAYRASSAAEETPSRSRGSCRSHATARVVTGAGIRRTASRTSSDVNSTPSVRLIFERPLQRPLADRSDDHDRDHEDDDAGDGHRPAFLLEPLRPDPRFHRPPPPAAMPGRDRGSGEHAEHRSEQIGVTGVRAPPSARFDRANGLFGLKRSRPTM